MDAASLVKLAYIIAAVLFILGLKFMGHPRTAVRGNFLGALGMLLAVLVTLAHHEINGYVLIALGIIIGSAIGLTMAVRVEMTSMPQLVALFNGLGGAASILVAGAELLARSYPGEGVVSLMAFDVLVATAVSGLIGSVTLTGSLIAFGKLQELKIFKKPISISGQHIVNGLLFALTLALAWLMVVQSGSAGIVVTSYLFLVIAACALGVLLVLPIGGADMPVVIALLNSYSGLAAAATGFVIDNNVLIIAGSLVGASGVILTQLMCKAMNRSLFNVLFGVMGAGGEVADADEMYTSVRSTSAEDVAMILESSQRVVVIPGYGMAVAQAQHAVRDLGKMIEADGGEVEFAIHPVAGRMPGHMNVLLAEADVPYEKLREMDDINPTMSQVDVAIVIGANDVVNPVARTDPKSPIAGMPIIDADKARTVIVIKRSLSPGFAGIPNPLFAADNTLMLFGDGQQAVLDIIAAMKDR